MPRTLTLEAPPARTNFDDWQDRRAYEALPKYPKFGVTVAKYRKLPRTPENVAAHAQVLFAQLATLQRAEFQAKAVEPTRACPCASGTWHTDGEKILKAINAQNRARIEAGLAESWRKRTDAQVGIAYRAAMEGKDAPLTHDIHVPDDQSRYR
jgi:hypothetical protein